ncbi:MAG TPA: rhomboid family intramembrane serine protease [Solirubrobacteraceae bacterium]
MSGQQPDLYVVCKSCGSEVSPYITECPYCGQRLRKRAPKIERDADGASRPKLRRRAPKPSLGPLRTGEIPGIKGDETRRPYMTMVLAALSIFGYFVLIVSSKADLVVFGDIGGEWWRAASGVFLYANFWYQLAAVLAIALFGFLLERHHGPIVVLLVFVLSGMGGIAAAAALETDPIAFGGNGAALGLLAAWAMPVIRARRRGIEDEADLLGTLAIACCVAAMPIATTDANPITGVVGLFAGGVIGLLLSALAPRH